MVECLNKLRIFAILLSDELAKLTTVFDFCKPISLPFDMDKPMGQVRQLDKRMNDAGLLRLMVSDPLAMNMSNTLGYLRGELSGKNKGRRMKDKVLVRRILELAPFKKMLLAVYNKIFSWYYS
jgi:hypothetical protein